MPRMHFLVNIFAANGEDAAETARGWRTTFSVGRVAYLKDNNLGGA